MREKYPGSIFVGFDGLPAIELETLITPDESTTLDRFSLATRRRKFTLRDDWEIDFKNIGYAVELNRTIVVPKSQPEHSPTTFDGASVPLPWLVSLLTIGILRPLGVMLVASIIHDYAFKFGHLLVRDGDQLKKVILERHIADKLFRDIVGTVSGLPIFGYIAWLAVRLGWPFIPYNNKYREGKKPYLEYIFAFIVVLVIIYLGFNIGFILLYIFLGIYMLLYIVSIIVLKWKKEFFNNYNEAKG